MKLVITRSNWLRGEGASDSFLLREFDRKMCCLGFLGLACGILEESLVNHRTPSQVRSLLWPRGVLIARGSNSEITLKLTGANDSQAISSHEREERLINEFSKIAIKVEFVD